MRAAPIVLAAWLVACDRGQRSAAILLFNGAGTSASDVAAIESVLTDNDLPYATADSAQLNAMSAARLRAFQLLIMPGGDFIVIGNGLIAATSAKIHAAVQDGMSYLGICAGAFLAGHSTHYRSFDLVPGVQFKFYAAEDRDIRKTVVPIQRPGAPALDQYWEDGPELDGWGSVVGRYPDGTAAIAQGLSGKGWVILTGVHAEAPASWRRGLAFGTSVEEDRAYAVTLINAALHRSELPHD